MRPRDARADNDGHGFFGAPGDAVVTGPTLTNVNDFRAAIIHEDRAPSGRRRYSSAQDHCWGHGCSVLC
jgi:hypothetical protein